MERLRDQQKKMEETRRNVLDEVSILKKEVRKASFIAMDGIVHSEAATLAPTPAPDPAMVTRLGTPYCTLICD